MTPGGEGVSPDFTKHKTLGGLLWTLLAWVFHSFLFFPLLLPDPELDKLKKLSHLVRNPGKQPRPPAQAAPTRAAGVFRAELSQSERQKLAQGQRMGA